MGVVTAPNAKPTATLRTSEGDIRLILFPDHAPKTVANFVAWFTNEENYCVVVEAEGRVTGIGVLKRSGDVNLLFLAPEARGRGMGKAVHAALEAQAERWGLREMKLESTELACRFYERLGYRSAGDARTQFGVLRAYPYVKALR